MLAYMEWFMIGCPLVGAIACALFARYGSQRALHRILMVSTCGAILLALPILVGHMMQPGLVGTSPSVPWIRIWTGDRFIMGPLVLRVDSLAITFVVLALLGQIYEPAPPNSAIPGRKLAPALAGLRLSALLLILLGGNLWTVLLGWSLIGWSIYALAGRNSASDGTWALFVLASDLCMLGATLILSLLTRSLKLDDTGLFGSMTPGSFAVPEALNAAGLLITVGATLRVIQVPFTRWPSVPGCAPLAAFPQATLLPSIYLLGRLAPLLQETASGLALLSWWGAISALVAAAAALCQPSFDAALRWSIASIGGCCLLGLGVQATTAVFSFLPACILVLLAARSLVDHPPGVSGCEGQGKSPALGRRGGGPASAPLAALSGYPLLPAFPFCVRLLSSSLQASIVQGVTVAAAIAVLAAAAARTAIRNDLVFVPRGPARVNVVVLGLFALLLGWADLPTPSIWHRLHDWNLAETSQPLAWGWYALQVGLVGAGAGLGMLVHHRSREEPARSSTIEIKIGAAWAAVLRVLQAASAWAAALRPPGWLHRLAPRVQIAVRREDDSDLLGEFLLAFVLGATVIISYLVLVRG